MYSNMFSYLKSIGRGELSRNMKFLIHFPFFFQKISVSELGKIPKVKQYFIFVDSLPKGPLTISTHHLGKLDKAWRCSGNKHLGQHIADNFVLESSFTLPLFPMGVGVNYFHNMEAFTIALPNVLTS